MADTTVTITYTGNPPNGTITPDHLTLNVGDTVSFQVDGADTLLCLSDDAVFGNDRYAISDGATLSLTVQTGAPGSFDFMAQPGDLSDECGGSRDGVEGGGQVGGGGPG